MRSQPVYALLGLMGWALLSHAQSTTYIGSPTGAPLGAASSGQDGVPGQQQPESLPGIVMHLSVKDAEAIALKNNPAISVARLTALASQQVVREARSALWRRKPVSISQQSAPATIAELPQVLSIIPSSIPALRGERR